MGRARLRGWWEQKRVLDVGFVLVKAEAERVSTAVGSVDGRVGLVVDSIRRWHAAE
jgi:hypothetical protein